MTVLDRVFCCQDNVFCVIERYFSMSHQCVVDFCFPVCHNRKCVFLVILFYITASLLPLFRVTAHRAMRFVGGGTGECVASGDDKIQEIWRGVMGYFVYLSKIGCGSAMPK